MESNTATNNTKEPTMIDLAAVDAYTAFTRDHSLHGFTIGLGDKPNWPVGFASILSFDPETRSGFAVYDRTGLLVRFVVTGKALRGYGVIRVQITAATDNNDLAGTVNFTEAKPVGGFINYDRFRA